MANLRVLSKEYSLQRVFYGIKSRCHNPNSTGYKNYGGRGIFLCESWATSPSVFVTWGLQNGYEKGLEIDRIDNEKGYSPDNCRFVSRIINRNNTRSNLVKFDDVQIRLEALENIPDYFLTKQDMNFRKKWNKQYTPYSKPFLELQPYWL